ncbi:MAG: nitroreductase [Clostridia bacterium]|nr:nitroreductase [Clostridia bacterium]
MNLTEAVKLRHSVRQYKDIPIEEDKKQAILSEIEEINRESGLSMQLVCDEPKAFSGFMAHYGNFVGVKNYIAIVGKKASDLSEAIGYYGERIVLFCQQLGLHTCWVALTYKKVPEAFKVEKGEKLYIVISVGHGRNRGLPRRSKKAEEVSNVTPDSPEWFKNGVELALLAPTATNQQKFYLERKGNIVKARALAGFYSKMDLGIVKYHFEIGAGCESFEWEK